MQVSHSIAQLSINDDFMYGNQSEQSTTCARALSLSLSFELCHAVRCALAGLKFEVKL